MPTEIVILIGHKGSGKSTIGAALGAACGTFLAIEEFFLEHYPDREEFHAKRSDAYEALEAEIERKLGSDRLPLVIEETAASSEAQELISRLTATHSVLLVAVHCDLEIALKRVSARSTVANYDVSEVHARNSHKSFEITTVNKYEFAARLENPEGADIPTLVSGLAAQLKLGPEHPTQ